MKKKSIMLITAVFFLVLTLQGVVPRKWALQSKSDFLKGKFEGISVSFDGYLSLSPKEEEIEGPAEDFYLSFLMAPNGVVYLGTGHGGKIYRINPGAKADLYFQVPEMDIYCLARDRRGNLYAGTSPNGKIYKITAKGEGEVFFNPNEKYIWDLLFVEADILLAAVGENGGIYRINKEGEGSLILKAEENHILCLKKDENENLFAGSGGNGLLYRLSPQGKASVLFESPYEEIKSIAFSEEGNIYVAAGGAMAKEPKAKPSQVTLQSETDISVTVTPSAPPLSERLPLTKAQPSALFLVNREGIAKRLWSSKEDLIYSLLWYRPEKKLVFGTGNRGRIFTIDQDEKISLLVQKNSEQVYALHSFDSRIYTVANNPSHLSLIYPEQRFEGEFLSHVLDTKTVSSWGRISWEGGLPSGTTLQIQTRAGNSKEPNQTWSGWSPPYQKKEGELVLSPKARYIQFKIIFKSQSGKVSPQLQKVSLFYLQTNIAPLISKVELLPANQVYLRPPEREEVIWGYESNQGQQSKEGEEAKTYVVKKKVMRKGFQTVTWEAADENKDSLVYKLLIKKEDETDWRVLKENWPDEIFTFDSFSFPDGIYFIKLIASDSPSNPHGLELQTEKLSQPLVIDNSLPEIKNFKVVRAKNDLEMSFEVEDTMSYIQEVKYLIRPDEWQTIFPVDGICDAKNEKFKLSLRLQPNLDNLITIKAKDSHDNIGVYRQKF
jgi:hypothetical protein